MSNVLVVGDLHSPFIKEGYLEHCIATKKRFKCDTVVFIGDVIDNHYSSFHESDPDGYGAGQELQRAIDKLRPFYEAFPNAHVTWGNHDEIITRKSMSAGLSKRWLRSYSEVLETPGWDFVEHVDIDGVRYQHGTGGAAEHAAFNRAKNYRVSVVQGHIHTAANIEFSAGLVDRVFGFQVGCGIDAAAYAMAYARNFTKKPIVSCGVVLDDGKLPILCPMYLGDKENR